MIRKMVSGDLEMIMILENRLFSCPWSLDNYRFELNENPYGHYVVLDDQGIKGYMGLWLNEESAQITTIGVDPGYQDHGYGKALVQYALDIVRARGLDVLTLEVRVSNLKAIGLYERFGFTKVALRRNYYSCPDEDALLMLKQL